MKSCRWIWFITLLFYCSGCTYYAPAYLPGDEPRGTRQENDWSGPNGGNQSSMESSEVAKVGGVLRLTLKDGEVVEGTVVEIGADSLAFGNPAIMAWKKTISRLWILKKLKYRNPVVLPISPRGYWSLWWWSLLR